MRRDQILKICLNFVLTNEIEFKRKDDQSWTFAACDFSEGEFEPTSFAIRFKNKEICDSFKNSIDNALTGKNEENNGSEYNELSEKSELIKRLLLPQNFFDYEKAKDCSGCLGCNSENYKYSSDKNSEFKNDVLSIPLIPPKNIIKAKPRRASQDKRVSFKLAEKKENEKVLELFGSSKKTEAVQDQVFTIQKSEATSNIFAQFNAENPPSSTFVINTQPFSTESSIFSSSLNTTPTNNTDNKIEQPSIFGNKAIYSFNSAGSNGVSVFGIANKENKTGDGTANTAFSGTPLFGSSIFGTSSNSNLKPSNEISSTNIFGSSTKTFSFAEAAKELDKSNGANRPVLVPEFLEKTNTFGGFAELAATQTSSPDTKPFSGQNNNAGSFFGLTVKDDFFSKNLNKQNISDSGDTSQNDSEHVAEDYDPHYDPIISLPDEINVSTGEEEEQKLYGERAKLYRYDVNIKEWKERGKKLLNKCICNKNINIFFLEIVALS